MLTYKLKAHAYIIQRCYMWCTFQNLVILKIIYGWQCEKCPLCEKHFYVIMGILYAISEDQVASNKYCLEIHNNIHLHSSIKIIALRVGKFAMKVISPLRLISHENNFSNKIIS